MYFASNYNTFLDELSSMDDTASQSTALDFYSDYVNYFALTYRPQANQKCEDLIKFISIVPWKDRLLDQAKKNFYTDYLPYTGTPIQMGTKTLVAIPSSYQTSIASKTAETEVATVTDYQPIMIHYNVTVGLGDSSAVVKINKTTIATTTRLFISPEATDTIYPTLTITSKIEQVVSAAAEALIYDYNQNSLAYESYIESNSNESFVQHYKSLIREHQKNNNLQDVESYEDIIQGFYNFIFQLSLEFKTR
ncbi:unnamed protein product [Ambrosiozyma monospora]|uniref:Unnamed protein product n=1 Tax=Ambrosiozyma monospora TaxID=43982 RepID=A0ACB5STW1_AMBMO|nr:unnamed protein product [Ambrosiozyma monospora]